MKRDVLMMAVTITGIVVTAITLASGHLVLGSAIGCVTFLGWVGSILTPPIDEFEK